MKAVLISIQPKWCELIASGQKTVEVRKTKPKLETPFKVYIYMTAGDAVYPVSINGAPYTCSNVGGKVVIGEFVCNKIDEFSIPYPAYFNEIDNKTASLIKSACLKPIDIHIYNGTHQTYAWHVSDLVIYDKPHPLSDFKPPCDGFDKRCQVSCAKITIDGKSRCTRRQLTRPPQSWCYVEEGGE